VRFFSEDKVVLVDEKKKRSLLVPAGMKFFPCPLLADAAATLAKREAAREDDAINDVITSGVW
jgi:hypothetical protein